MDHYDRLEARTPQTRANKLMHDLRAILAIARGRAPALRAQLKGVDVKALKSPADLAAIPVIRKSELRALQEANPPFGGLVATRPGALRRLMMSPGPIFEPEGRGKDWWGAARAMHAAGFRKEQVVVNCFSYHLTPGGHIMDCGAQALGCAVIPAGTENVERQVEAIAHLRATNYCGTPDFLKKLLDKAKEMDRDISCLVRALVSGAALPATLRAELQSRGVGVRQAYASADLGVVAYETGKDGKLNDGMVVTEGIILEIVRPGTGEPVKAGEVGEVVVTRLNPDYPLLRFGTGDLSAVMAKPSPCGRTNTRIKGWLGRADQRTKVKGMFVEPAQVAEVGRRHPELGRLRLVVRRAGEQDAMTLHAEANGVAAKLSEMVAATLRDVTKLKGAVEFAALGSLPNDGKVIADERPVG